ncbi:MAG: sigma-70 family RNA polymerase sigma factor [Planctomycetales bacterium]|nr:sigma-70 family RNA polymerase sigma factor [Planctomycetales bacterium]
MNSPLQHQESTQNVTSHDVEVFVELLAQHDARLSSYVMSMVPTVAEAQDILQDTKLALWRSFNSYELGTDFGAWARRAALNRILDFRKRKSRENKHIWFSDQCYELLAEEFESKHDLREERMLRLKECIAKLTQRNRQLLIIRYFQDSSIDDAATRVGRSVEATYRALSRIRLALRNCLTMDK